MNLPKVSPCPNCGNTSFGGFTKNGGTPYAFLYSAKKIDDNNFEPDLFKGLGVIPISCDKCGHIKLFVDK